MSISKTKVAPLAKILKARELENLGEYMPVEALVALHYTSVRLFGAIALLDSCPTFGAM